MSSQPLTLDNQKWKLHMKQKVTLASVIMMVVEFVLFFTPYCFIVNYWEYENSIVYHGIMRLEYKEHVDIFALNNTVSRILAITSIFIVILALILYIMMLLGKKSPISKYTYFLPSAILVVFLAHVLYSAFLASYDSTYWYNDCSPNWGAFVILGMNIVLAILGILLKQERFSCQTPQEEIKVVSSTGKISDELNTY